MKRHLIIGRFGPGDRTAISTAPDEVPTPLDLVASEKQLGHGIGGALADLKKLNVFPTEFGLDLLILAALVHAADTRISRESESQDTWTREIRLVVPVSDPARWNAAIAVLQRMLNFLTGDKWTLGFRARPAKFAKIVPAQELLGPPFDGVSLFSGGLDSLVGAIDLLEAGGVPLLVSHASEPAVSAAQDQCFDALKAHYKKQPFERLRVWMNFSRTLVRGVDPEDTTRGRSFLFFALGIFVGSGLRRAFTLRVPENGLIALNVPLDTLRLGALSTRTTHPFYIARWNDLLGVLGISGRIKRDRTKGEMAQACANPRLLQELLPSSLSCSSPTKGRWQGHGTEHCGFCLPCLIRRAALAGLRDPTSYTVPNLRAQIWDTKQAKGEGLLIMAAKFHLTENAFALQLLFQRPYGALYAYITKPGWRSSGAGGILKKVA